MKRERQLHSLHPPIMRSDVCHPGSAASSSLHSEPRPSRKFSATISFRILSSTQVTPLLISWKTRLTLSTSDFFYNATEAEDEKSQWHEEELHDTAALAFGSTFLGHKCKSRFNAPHDDEEDITHLLSRRRPRFGFPAAGRLPSQECKGKGPCTQLGVPDEEIPIPHPPEHEPKTGLLDDKTLPHWPPRWPAPAKFQYTLPTVLEDGVLHVTITKPHPHHSSSEGSPDPEFPTRVDVPPGTPAEHEGPKRPPHHPLFKSSFTVNGQQTRLEAVARNGAVHTIGRLLNPFKKPHHEPPKDPKEGEDDEWADWEDWLPAWAEL